MDKAKARKIAMIAGGVILALLLVAAAMQIAKAGITDGPDVVGLQQTEPLPPDVLRLDSILSPCPGTPGGSCYATCQSAIDTYSPGSLLLTSMQMGDVCECSGITKTGKRWRSTATCTATPAAACPTEIEICKFPGQIICWWSIDSRGNCHCNPQTC